MLCAACSAQTGIDLTGTVLTRAGRGANGLEVRLLSAGISDTTGADGTFWLLGQFTGTRQFGFPPFAFAEKSSAVFINTGTLSASRPARPGILVDLRGRSLAENAHGGMLRNKNLSAGAFVSYRASVNSQSAERVASAPAAVDTAVVMYRQTVLARKAVPAWTGSLGVIQLTDSIPVWHCVLVSDPMDNRLCMLDDRGAVFWNCGAAQVIDVWQLDNGNILLNDLTGVREISPRTNPASLAAVTASSEYGAAWSAQKAVDGVIGVHNSGEWASSGEQNPWIQLSWATPRAVSRIILYDRPNPNDQANGGTLTFSDCTSLTVDSIPGDGSAKEISFPEKSVMWVKFQVIGGAGPNVGLSEIEVNERRVAWEYPVAPHTSSWSVQPLPDGTYAIAVAGPPEILIVNRSKQLLRTIPLQNFFPSAEHQQVRHVRRTPRGTWYVCFFYSNLVQEVDSAGRVLWSYTIANPHKTVPLPNGNRLISTGQSRIVELNPRDSIVWELRASDFPTGFFTNLDTYWNYAQRAPNGNTIFTNARGNPAIIEVSPQKEVLWSLPAVTGMTGLCEFHIMNESSLDLVWPLK